MNAYKLSVSEAECRIREGWLTPSQLLEDVLDRIENIEPRVGAWVTLDIDGAKREAERLTAEADEGEYRGPLHGIPVGVKDIFYTAGLRTTMGSPIYKDFVPLRDAESVSLLKGAGAFVLGKTETTEFALADPARTRNPWNLGHTPGGSSSGSAAAVSSGMCPTALGSQTGGSVIRPASFCGIVGFKPTYGSISVEGVYPLSWSLDHVGFFTRTVEDCAIMLNVLRKEHEETIALEPTQSPTLGLLTGYFRENADRSVWEGHEEVLGKLQDAGATVREVQLPKVFKLVHAAHRVIMASEAASAHEVNFKERFADYRINLKGLIASGQIVPATTYMRAQRIRTLFMEETREMLRGLDCVVTPSAPTSALLGLDSTGSPAFNAPWSFCGFPAITLPSGITKKGLPLGLQLVGVPYAERDLLLHASWCESVLDFGEGPRDLS